MSFITKAMQEHSKQALSVEEVKTMMIQQQKDGTLSSLLYVTRKLGEVEGMISMQVTPDKAIVAVQKDFKRLYDKLVEEAGIELLTEPERVGDIIGGDSS